MYFSCILAKLFNLPTKSDTYFLVYLKKLNMSYAFLWCVWKENLFNILDSLEAVLNGLKNALASYVAMATDVLESISCMKWWRLNEQSLQCWSTTAKMLY